MNTAICNVIENRRILDFNYQGHHRIVEPHAYGLSHTGKEVIRAYQTDDTSHSGTVPCWRLFDVALVESLTVTEKCFEGVRDGYIRGDRGMSTIFCEL